VKLTKKSLKNSLNNQRKLNQKPRNNEHDLISTNKNENI